MFDILADVGGSNAGRLIVVAKIPIQLPLTPCLIAGVDGLIVQGHGKGAVGIGQVGGAK